MSTHHFFSRRAKKDQAEEQKAALQKDIKVPADEICDPDSASAGKPLKSC
jgi:hypothetical protein